jgi:outer membrane protein OmpA-like peptidoglycan-associated protein
MVRGKQYAAVGPWIRAFACVVSVLGLPREVAAEGGALPLRVRATLGGAAMVSTDQVGRLGYDSFGGIGELQLAYVLQPWLDVQLGIAGGGFPAGDKTGGLLAPALGATLALPSNGYRPFLTLDVGPGFTGALARPFFRGGVGVELRVTDALNMGPVVGYGQLFQTNSPGSSTDARFIWFGVVLSVRPGGSSAPQSLRSEVHWTTRRRTVVAAPRSAEPYDPPPPAAPSPELSALLEAALPAQRVELLAPVLFQFNSAELEPLGVAMLHEVARERARRPDIKLLEVQGYADSRGAALHNLDLSERRAARVVDWLVAHGVARDRLRSAPRGAAEFVENGSSESEHEQNRRVVFRVVNAGDP